MNKLIRTIRNRRATGFAAGVILAAMIGLAALGSLPTPVQAADPPVILGDEADTVFEVWALGGIVPCQGGSRTATLQNAGPDGSVYIWISDILSGEGDNPEPETDTEEPGELINWLVLNASTPGLETNLALPTTIDNYPQSANYTDYIRVPLVSGETAILEWQWELPCETGNDAQGDTLSFNINYSLDIPETPPPPPPPPPPPGRPPERQPPEPYIPPPPPDPEGFIAEVSLCPADVLVYTDPGRCFASRVDLGIPTVDYQQDCAAVTNDAPSIFPVGETIVTWTITDCQGNRVTCTQKVTVLESERYIEIDMLGEITRVRLKCPDCTVAETSVVSDPDDMHFLTIEIDTRVLCVEDDTTSSCPELIVMSISEETLSMPYGFTMISPVYEFIGYGDKELLNPICSQVNFDLPITVLLSYDPAELPPGASSPFIAHLDTENNALVRLDYAGAGQVANVGEVNGLAQHLSLFAVVAELPADPYRIPMMPHVDWRLVVGIVGGALLVLGLLLFNRRRRRKGLTTGN